MGIAAPAFCLDSSNVLVVYNASSTDGAQIASYYAQVHPGVRLLGIQGLQDVTSEEVTYDVYLQRIRPAIVGSLDSSVDCIVTTKGLPLRIDNPMPSGWSGSWNRYSSLESELTRVDVIGTRELMGNQSYSGSNPLASNPYYLKSVAFDHDLSSYGTVRLTARLDGFTACDVIGAIDRARRAVVGRPGYEILVDDHPGTTDRMTQLHTVLDGGDPNNPRIAHTFDGTSTFVQNSSLPYNAVIGYVSHGVNAAGASPAVPSDYILNTNTGLKFTPADGAVFHTWESYNAYTFTEGVSAPVAQGLLAQWLRKGGTAATGQVQEPYASATTVANEDRMFKMLLDGYTFGEAAWNATKQLSYVNTVVGDPLMKWRQWLPGDYDLDGDVDSIDLGAVQQALGTWSGDVGYDMLADMDGNGAVDWHDQLCVETNFTGPGDNGGIGGDMGVIPEPTTVLLLCIGAVSLLRRGRIAP